MKLLKQKYNRKNYLDFLQDKFNLSKFIESIESQNQEVKSFEKLGFITIGDNKTLPVFEIHIKSKTKLERNRVGLRNLVAREVKNDDGALAVYIDDESKQWRFSFIAIEYEFGDNGIEKEQTASKRFTYLFGEGAKTRTAENRFEILNENSTLADLKTAFAVEPLNKEFYGKLFKWYEKAQEKVKFPNDENTNNHIETSLIRFLTRILFVWFLKEKKLINPDLFDLEKLKNLIDYEKDSSFYKAILQNLFFATLNRQIIDRSFRTTTNGKANQTNYLATNIYRYQNHFKNNNEKNIMALFNQTPFLNGGLFECLDREATDEEKSAYNQDKSVRKVGSAIRIEGFSDRDDNELKFSNELFFNDDLGLIDLFNQYQFTIEESTPTDIEVALDPELLGKVFENLLATYNPETGEQASKATGSFYTPREIVSYMVDESLKQHFKTHTDLNESQINDCFVEGKNELDEAQIKEVIEAIDNLKILDPAVGSGAYPMGILQRLVSILNKIDPENIHFKQRQLDKTKTMDEMSKKASIEAIEKVFSVDNQYNAYAQKLILIENSIYGVDIQPIAIQICKLRFFISLTIEQQPDKDKENYGIKALPNLETKFIVANTLLPLGEKPQQAGLFDIDIDNLKTNLAEVRHQYFSAKTLKTKRKYREQDQQLREQMLETLKQSGISPEVEASMNKVVNWDLYNQNSQSDWFDSEWQFGVKDGFDIVIGNPPYVKTENITDKIKKQLKIHFIDKNGRGWNDDLYCHFIFKAFDLCKHRGMVSLITNDSFVGLKSKERVRNLLYENKLFALVKCPYETFNASIYTAIFVAQKNVKTNDYEALEFIYPNYDIQALGTIKINFLKTLPYKKLVYPSSAFDIYKKAQTDCRLDQLVNILDTGIDSGNVRYRIFSKESNLNTPYRLLQGKHINRYKIQWHEINQGYKYCNIDYQCQPVKGIGRGGKPSKKDEYWRFRGNKDNHHLPERLLLRQTDDDLVAMYHSQTEHRQFYTDNTLHTITPKNKEVSLKFILALINSKLLNFLYHFLSQEQGKTLAQVKTGIVNKLSIPETSKTEQQPFIDLVNKILTAKKDGKDTTALETQINKLVYQLYDLTDAEIKIIENK